MAISASAVWEIRPGSGADTNGGGFVTGASGTDYSQQNAAQYALTGLTTSAANAIILTASAAADMVGNIIQITSGTNFTAGFYQILSVVVGVSITVDRNCTTAAGASGVANIGGALATFSTAYLNAQIASMVTYVKATGTLTITSAINIPVLNSNAPLTYIGYTTTRGDNGRATITTATNSVDIFAFAGGSGYLFRNFTISTTAGTAGNGFHASGTHVGPLTIINTKMTGFTEAVHSDDSSATFEFSLLTMVNVEISGGAQGIVTSGTIAVFGAYIHGCSSHGIHRTTQAGASAVGAMTLANVIVYSCGGNGIFDEATSDGRRPFQLINSTCASNTGDGLKFGNQANSPVVIGCIFDSNGGWGINAPSTTTQGGVIGPNAYRSNTNGTVSGTFPTMGTDVTLTADPFTNRSGGDFSLNNIAGGGAACRALDFPGALLAGGTGYADIGPLQHQEYVHIPVGMRGGF